MCDKDDCQLKRDEILSLQCLRFDKLKTEWDKLTDNQKQNCVKTIGDFVESVKTQTDQKTTSRLSYGCDQYDELKSSLPVWVCCGVGGTKQETITPNGLVTIDIDHIDGYEQQIKDRLCELPFIALCCLSISGHGVYALAYAPDYTGNAERIKSELYTVTAYYLSAVCDIKIIVKDGKLEQPDAANIDNCTDVSRKRFEPFDTDVYVADKVKAFEPISDLMSKKWNNSKIKRLVEMMGYNDINPNHAGVGALLAVAAAITHLTLWDWDIITPFKSYQVRIGSTIIGWTGDGKGLLNTMVQIIADKFNCTCGNCKSTADMAFRASLACNTIETDENKKQTWKDKQIKDIKPFIELNDEVYATITANKTAQYAIDKTARRRELLDTHFNPPTTKKDSLPEYKFTPCYQYLCFSQFDSYAEAITGERTDTGDGRRELLCELPKIETDGLPLEVSLIKDRMKRSKSDLDGVYQALKDAYDHNIDRINSKFEVNIENLSVREIEGESLKPEFPAMNYESRALCLFTFFRCLEGLNEQNKRDAFTHIPNIATLSAFLEQRDCITTSDILIAAAITRASFALRDKLQDRCNEITLSDGCDKQITWLNKYWELPDKSVKVANYQKAKVNNGIGLSKVTKEIVEKWELNNLVIYQIKTNKYTRRGTPQELEQIEKDLEIENAIKNKSGSTLNEMTLNWNATHGHNEQFATRKRPTFSQDTQDAQRIRVVEMVHKSLEGGKCGYFVKGQRERTLYRLCNVLKNNGMWGTIGKEILEGLARESGLPEKEIQHALR